MKRALLLICWWVALGTTAWASDTNRLSFIDYMNVVRQHHPLALQAGLQPLKGAATVRQARGAFDPKASYTINEKDFKDLDYYRLLDGSLKVPTWFGVELQAGYEQNEGVFLNPEDNTPGAGLWHAGISVAVGQGLFIDQRRAGLRQAQLYQEATRSEQQLLVNNLLYEAGAAYWNWFQAFHALQVYEEAVALTRQRFEAVRQGAEVGDRPEIDTLEAGIQLQNRTLSLQQAQLDFNNASALLAVYLWADGMVPLELETGTIPTQLSEVNGRPLDTSLRFRLDTLSANHPEMRLMRNKIDQLSIDQRLKREQLKPTLNLKYNAISQPVDDDPFNNYNTDDYTWGLEFGIPIFLRKERGAVALARLKLQEAELEQPFKRATLNAKAIATMNTWETTYDQITLFGQTVQDYRGLLQGEQDLFDAGESSLFLVNSRELGYINSRIKFLDLLAKNRKAQLATNHALGLLAAP